VEEDAAEVVEGVEGTPLSTRLDAVVVEVEVVEVEVVEVGVEEKLPTRPSRML